MTRRSHAHAVDANQSAIIDAAEGLGYSVVNLSSIGKGVPDLVVIRPSDQRAWLIEVKVTGGTLTEAEMMYGLRSRTPVWVVQSVEDLLKVIGVTR